MDITATLDGEAAYQNADFYIVVPTNYHQQDLFFDTCHVEAEITLCEGLPRYCDGMEFTIPQAVPTTIMYSVR